MSYQVFARKYRPQTFDDVVGQEHITRTLKNAIAQNRLAHAYLFVGPRGTGKTSTARILSKALCCIHAPTITPCGVCDPCREIAAGTSLDVLEIDGASNNGVEQVRELRENVRYAPTRGHFKIYIIDEVHMLTAAAFNALLKTLEEPPEHVKFIFATTEPQKVLPTILSRCQRFDLRRIPAPLIAAHLQTIAGKETITLAEDAAEAIARGAEGGLRDAESMLDQLVAFCGERISLDDVLGIFGFTAPEVVASLVSNILSGQTPDALAALDAQAEGGKDLLRLMAELIAHLRDLLVFQVNSSAVAKTPQQEATFQAQAPLASTERLLGLIDDFALAEGRMKWAPNKKLHFEIAIIKAIQTLGQSTLTEVIDALSALRDPSAPILPLAAHKAQPTPSAKSPAELAPKNSSEFAAPVTVALDEAEPASEPAVAPALLAEVPVSTPAPAIDLNGPELWQGMIREIKSQRPLITAWVQLGEPGPVEAGALRVVFPSDQKMSVESLNKPNTRKFLESLLAKFAGRAIELRLELGEKPASSTPPASPGNNGAHAASATVASNVPSPPENSPSGDLEDDPLIQKALRIFEGQIRA